jgi:tRNA(Ile)-lysidine synthase
MAMLYALASLRAEKEKKNMRPLDLLCVHIDHSLRGEESTEDARFVKNTCEKLGIPCAIYTLEPGSIYEKARRQKCGIEAAAREARFKALKKEAAQAGAERILIAHTYDDFLETILMRILRGAGPAGLAPMRRDTGLVYRPLLAVSRNDVLAYLTERNLPWREDSSNTGMAFTRNRTRHKLIPVLNKHFPNWQKNIAAFAETQRFVSNLLAHYANEHIRYINANEVHIDNFNTLPPLAAEEALFAAINYISRQDSAAGGGAGGFSFDDILPPPDGKTERTRTVKRAVLRKWAAGKTSTLDMGQYCAFHLPDGSVRVTRKPPPLSGCGFSLALKRGDAMTVIKHP